MFKKSFAIIIFAIILDQLTKYLILSKFSWGGTGIQNTEEVTSFFNIVLVWNRGVSFGMFANAVYAPYIFSILTIIIIIILLFMIKNSHSNFDVIGYSLIIGGAIGNLIDRIRFGAVIDFLDFHISHNHWPAFNLADSFICVGAVMIIFESFILWLLNRR